MATEWRVFQTGQAPSVRCESCPERQRGLFCGLNAEELKGLSRSKSMSRFGRGQLLFQAGNPVTTVYCVHSGLVKLYRLAFNGKEQILRLAGPGALLGYRSLLRDKPHEHFAEILEEGEVCCIPAAAIKPLMDGAPRLLQTVITTLTNELEEMEERCVERSQAKAEVRLAALLVRSLPAVSGKVELPLSRQEIADLLGTAPETVIRLLRGLHRRGLVKLKGREIDVPSRARLERFLQEEAYGRRAARPKRQPRPA